MKKCLKCLVNPEWECRWCNIKACSAHEKRPLKRCKMHCGKDTHREFRVKCRPTNVYSCTTTNHGWNYL